MTQSYYIRTLSGASVLFLTVANIFLTVRLLHTTNCSSSSSPPLTLSVASSLYQEQQQQSQNNVNNDDNIVSIQSDNNNNNNNNVADVSSVDNNNNIKNKQQMNQDSSSKITLKNCLSNYDIQQQQDIRDNQKQNHNIEHKNEQQQQQLSSSNSNYYETKIDINFNLGRWDNQHLFKLHDFIIIGNKYVELSKKYSVCLATQSSIERLYSIVQVAEHWNGPISLGVYTAGDDEYQIFKIFITYLRNCYKSIRENISFHLAVPKDKIPKNFNNHLTNASIIESETISSSLWSSAKKLFFKKFHIFADNKFVYNSQNCLQPPEMILRRLLKLRTPEMIKWRQKNPYPQNHMRNLARKGCQTSNVFLTDVDIIPSINFTENVDKFLKNAQCIYNSNTNNGGGGVAAASGIAGGNIRNNKNSGNIISSNNNGGGGGNLCAYVVPTYEIDFRVKFPSNKSDLLRLVNKGLARPFHEKVFVYNQYATNFSRWQKEENSNPDTHISHNVTNFEFLYEPFYISTDNVPLHDERFLGYGFTRNSQVYEMYIAGYKFQVLSPIFTCHWGLQQKKTRPAWREQQNNVNRKHFERFKREILARYSKDHPTSSVSIKSNKFH